jgi:hypothetical protein
MKLVEVKQVPSRRTDWEEIITQFVKSRMNAAKDDEFIFVDSVTGASFRSTLEKVEEAKKEVSAEYERDGDANW